MNKTEFFPDGTTIDDWFFEDVNFLVNNIEKEYCLTDYGIKDDGKIYTEKIQSLIDNISNCGGGVLVVPKGTYITGALFFKKMLICL